VSLAGGGSGGGSNAIRAGRAFVELFVKDKITGPLGRIGKGFQSFGSKLTMGGGALMGLGASVLGPAIAGVKSMLDHFGDMQDAADRLSSTPEIVSALGYAADQSGASLQDVEIAAKGIYKTLAAQGKTGGALDEEFLKLAEALDAIEDPAKKSALAMEVMGKSGLKMLPMLKGGRAGLEALFGKAAKTGSIVTSENAAKAEAAGDALNDIWLTFKNTLLITAASILPFESSIQSITEKIVEAGGATRQWITDNAGLIVGIGAAAAGGFTLSAAGVVAGIGITALGTAIGAVSTLLGLVLSPIGLTVLAVGGLTAAFLTLTPEGRDAASAIAAYFTDSAATFATTWGGIQDALKSGDLALAGQIAMAGLNVEWIRGINKLKEGWSAFGEHFVEGWHDSMYLVKQTTFDGMEKMQSVFKEKWSTMLRISAAGFSLFDSEMADNLRFLADANETNPELLRKSIGEARFATDREHDAKKDERKAKREADLAKALAELDAAKARFAALNAKADAAADLARWIDEQKKMGPPKPEGRPGGDPLAELGKQMSAGLTRSMFTSGGFAAQAASMHNPVVKAVKDGNDLAAQGLVKQDDLNRLMEKAIRQKARLGP